MQQQMPEDLVHLEKLAVREATSTGITLEVDFPVPSQIRRSKRAGICDGSAINTLAEANIVPMDDTTSKLLWRAFTDSPYIGKLSHVQRRLLIARMSPMVFKEGQVVIRQGDDGDRLYVR